MSHDPDLPRPANDVLRRRDYLAPVPDHGPGRNVAPPIFNLPAGVKSLILILVALHLAQRLMPTTLDDRLEGMFGYYPYRYWLLLHGQWAGPLYIVVLTPLTYMFLHANWLHLGINVMSLAAFGTGVERLVGPSMMMWLFLLCGVCGAFTEFAVNPTATSVVIGASAGVSGLFAIALMSMLRTQNLPRLRLYTALGLVLVTMVIMGQDAIMGMNVAWVSHIGGFLAGLVADSCLTRRDGHTPMRDLGWICAVVILPVWVLVTNVSKYF